MQIYYNVREKLMMNQELNENQCIYERDKLMMNQEISESFWLNKDRSIDW